MGLIRKIFIGSLCSLLCFDVLWFARLIIVIISSKLRRKLLPYEEGIIYGICSTQDLDFMGHMNNARYFRELDFARFDFFLRSGLSRYIFYNRQIPRMYCVIHSSNIRYRRSIDFLNLFSIRSKLVWWDSRTLFFEHRFITLGDGFVRAIGYSRCSIMNCDVAKMMIDLDYDHKPSNKIPTEIESWIQHNETSSQMLKQELLQTPSKSTKSNQSKKLEIDGRDMVYCSSSENLVATIPKIKNQ